MSQNQYYPIIGLLAVRTVSNMSMRDEYTYHDVEDLNVITDPKCNDS